ncbi:hypothetical protein HPB51_018179 [Rhipicephalus microplus]|uniref:Uncharacterized protein n=1 Tax=Rhipicephalus microplus TaxID=6941 RepID=A0A9J6D663_RHIMP|nr:hypothetical protein HPB51_018179 [Rhipicephalus microplus]
MAASHKFNGRRIVLQWNYRGFKNKKSNDGAIDENALKNKLPDVISLLEPFDRAQLPGYVTCGSPWECTGKDIKVCTLVKRETAFINRALDVSEESDVEHALIEVMPGSGTKKTDLFMPDVYSAPSKRGFKHNFSVLFHKAMTKVASSPLLIRGDSIAPHMQWGYGADSPKEKRLAGLMSSAWLYSTNRCRMLESDWAHAATRHPTSPYGWTQMAKLRHKYKNNPEAFADEIVQTHLTRSSEYIVVYVNWSRSETEKLNVAIPKAFKTALRVPQYTKTHRLLELGMHNTLDQIVETQKIAQLERLSHSRTARNSCILEQADTFSTCSKFNITWHRA